MEWSEERYDEFVKMMEERHPVMFSQSYGGFAIGEGWWHIIEELCGNIEHHLKWKNRDSVVVAPVIVDQIKEKFGGLRFYYRGGDDEISGMVRMAESWAADTCEQCGARGKRRDGGWVQTLCDEHESERQARYAEMKE